MSAIVGGEKLIQKNGLTKNKICVELDPSSSKWI